MTSLELKDAIEVDIPGLLDIRYAAFSKHAPSAYSEREVETLLGDVDGRELAEMSKNHQLFIASSENKSLGSPTPTRRCCRVRQGSGQTPRTGVFFDGVDLRNSRRWSRNIPVEVAVALELGVPPEFDGVLCVDCGKRFRTEFDHVQPRVALGPSSHGNLKPRCWSCHRAKTKRDPRAGKLKPAEP